MESLALLFLYHATRSFALSLSFRQSRTSLSDNPTCFPIDVNPLTMSIWELLLDQTSCFLKSRSIVGKNASLSLHLATMEAQSPGPSKYTSLNIKFTFPVSIYSSFSLGKISAWKVAQWGQVNEE